MIFFAKSALARPTSRVEVEEMGGGVAVSRGVLEQLKEYIVPLLSNR